MERPRSVGCGRVRAGVDSPSGREYSGPYQSGPAGSAPFSPEVILTETVPKTALAVTTPQIEAFRTLYDPDLDFRKLLSEATDFVRGFRLVEKSMLIGIPHVVISVTYREGYQSETGIVGDFASVEAVVADAETLNTPQMRKLREDRELEVFPNEAVVFNDGGKGIRRDLTQRFTEYGFIDPGKNSDGVVDPDRPYSLWTYGADEAKNGFTADANGRPLRIFALRGLRISEYESPYGPAETYYFA